MPQSTLPIKEAISPAAPRYADRELLIIHRFLAACLLTAEKSLTAVRATAGKDRNHPLFAGQIRHYEGVIAGLKWAGHLATYRQPHLLDPENTLLIERMLQWQQQQET